MAQSTYHARIGASAKLPISPAQPILSFSPVVLDAPDRLVPLDVRVTIPAPSSNGNGTQQQQQALPIILLSHGQGPSNSLSSLEGYAPLAQFWAAHGFAVLQPTHLSSAHLGLNAPTGQEIFYQERARDFSRILDALDVVEAAVPGLAPHRRLDRARVAVAGHSGGGLTATMLLGAVNTDPRGGEAQQAAVVMREPRITAGIVLGGVGAGREHLTATGQKILPFLDLDFEPMTTPTLVVYGDEDDSVWLSTRGPSWHADPYVLGGGSKSLLVLKGAKHGLGGISGWDASETDDESPERLAAVQRMTWAYLRSQLYGDGRTWEEAKTAFNGLEMGTVESK